MTCLAALPAASQRLCGLVAKQRCRLLHASPTSPFSFCALLTRPALLPLPRQVRRGMVPIKRPTFGNIVADRSEEEQIRLRAQLPPARSWPF